RPCNNTGLCPVTIQACVVFRPCNNTGLCCLQACNNTGLCCLQACNNTGLCCLQACNNTGLCPVIIQACVVFRPCNNTGLCCLQALLVLSSGWICYAEKTHGEFILPYVSSTRSPQQMMGSLVKGFFAGQQGLNPQQIYHVTVMPCYDKKLEASRPDFYLEEADTREVDCVITSGEVLKMLEEEKVLLSDVEPAPLDTMFSSVCGDELLGHAGSGSGGYLHHVFTHAARQLFGEEVKELTYKTLKNKDFQEVTLERDGVVVLRFATTYGFRNIQNLVQKLKRGKSPYHFVEVMACPSGCLNGGGQVKPLPEQNNKELLQQVEDLYKEERPLVPEEDQHVAELYQSWLQSVGEERARELLHTQYHAVDKATNGLLVKW
ncbi:unnamed protein product, partial [Oncorhynchus mykiss]